jgi:hypothetical protein
MRGVEKAVPIEGAFSITPTVVILPVHQVVAQTRSLRPWLVVAAVLAITGSETQGERILTIRLEHTIPMHS